MRSRPFKSGTATVFVHYGYDEHCLVLSGRALARIQAGKLVTIKGQGFHVEGVMEQDLWAFNGSAVGAIHVSTDTGRDVFEGNLSDDEVAVVVPARTYGAQKQAGDPFHPESNFGVHRDHGWPY